MHQTWLLAIHINQQPGSLHGTNQGPLHIFDSCVSWSSYGTPNNEIKGYP